MESLFGQDGWMASRTRSLRAAIALSCSVLAAGSAFAADSRPPDLLGGLRFGVVHRLHGDVIATAPTGGTERKLREGEPVFVGERLRAAATAEAVLKTDDAGMIAIRPGSDFVAERFAAQGKSTDGMTVRIFSGSLRVITGWIARIAAPNHKVATPTATIGIRGTDHEPYVLSPEMAKVVNNRAGTYDKVNRGGTTMVVGDNRLDIDSGKVGFVRDAATQDETRAKTRLLMTILMPVLLEKVPDFYVPGRFDAELDKYSAIAATESQNELARLRGESTAAAPAAPRTCTPTRTAKIWLTQLDGAAAKKNAKAIIAKFAPDVAVKATVRNTDGSTTVVELGREELAQSTVAAIKGLSAFKHRRISIEAAEVEGSQCAKVQIKSVVIEQGRQSGKPYRFESLEQYVLEQRDGKWLAVKAETTQR